MNTRTNRRIAVLGAIPDPVAQLVAATAPYRDARFLPAREPGALAGAAEAVLACSQDRFLAAVSEVRAARLPVTLVLRRRRPDESQGAWETGLSLLARVLAATGELRVTLVALTPEAAAATGARLGREVAVLEPLPASAPALTGGLDARGAVVTLNDGATLEILAMNRARLARLVALEPPEGAPEDVLDLAAFGAGPGAPGQGAAAAPSRLVLFVVPNGVGLGHLTRLLALARELRAGGGAQPVFWCYSFAAALLQDEGFAVLQRHTAAHLGTDRRVWRENEAAAFAAFLALNPAAAVVYDGPTLPAALRDALKSPGQDRAALIWVRRGLWREGSNAAPIQNTQACDLILEPGDLAAEADRGPTATLTPEHRGLGRFVKSPPVILSRRSEMLPRREARRALGLGRFGRYCLVSLGGDALADHGWLSELIAAREGWRGVRFVWAQSPLAAPPRDGVRELRRISAYPLGPYLAAFDGIITAAGYNSFHETLLLTDLPVLFAPSENPRLDDQRARAEFAAARGWAFTAPPAPGPDWDATFDRFVAAMRAGRGMPRPAETRRGAEVMCDAILRAAGLADTGPRGGADG